MPPKRNIKIVDEEIKNDKKQNKKKPVRKLSRESESEDEFSDSTELEESDVEEEIDDEIENEDDNLDDEKEGDDESTASKSVVDEGEVEEEIEEGDEECLYKNVKVLKKEDDEEDEEEVLVFEDDDKTFDDILPKEKRITKPFLTKYERVRILGDRAKQLSLGAKPMIKGTEGMNPKDIARAELEEGMVPFIIIRTLPNGSKEYWNIKELQIVN